MAPGPGPAGAPAAACAKYFAGQAASEIFGGYMRAPTTAYITMLSVGEGASSVQGILIAEDAAGYKDADRHPVQRRTRNR